MKGVIIQCIRHKVPAITPMLSAFIFRKSEVMEPHSVVVKDSQFNLYETLLHLKNVLSSLCSEVFFSTCIPVVDVLLELMDGVMTEE